MDSNNQHEHGSSLIDNFEASFMNCIHSFTKQESAIDVDKGEINYLLSYFVINTILNFR
jgi:hypothetical protein